MIGRPARIITNLIAFFFLILFLAMITVFFLGFFGAPIDEGLSDLFVYEPVGWLLLGFVGFAALTFIILTVAFWMLDNRWKDLRYKMAFFLYHSKVNKNDKIPLAYLARVGVCSINEISETLENMIARNELKGIVDRDRGLYIHKGLTRRGMKVLVALPPAGMTGLQQVKQYALKGHAWGEKEGEEIEELEEVDMEELPSAHDPLKKKERNKIACPHCGRMNIKDHQFCTFCGEVI